MQGSAAQISLEVKERAFRLLEGRSNVVSFQTNSNLAALCTCIGLHEELGHPDYDRLSLFFGVDPHQYLENPWTSELVFKAGEIGIRFKLKEQRPLDVKHPDLMHLLHPASLKVLANHETVIGQIIIFPSQVARHYAKHGLELVIVKDWILRGRGEDKVSQTQAFNYLQANIHEIEANTAKFQCEMLLGNQLAFSGTHDVVDHLFGFSAQGIAKVKVLCLRIKEDFKSFFPVGVPPKRSLLVLSYLLGIILDDLAQPRWYGSHTHFHLADLTLLVMHRFQYRSTDLPNLVLNHAFAELISEIRSQESSFDPSMVARTLSRFVGEPQLNLPNTFPY